MWAYLLLVCWGAVGIFDTQRDNPWDAVREVFYTHRFSNGEVYRHPASLDGPPWYTWVPFYNDDEFYARVVDILQAFLNQSAKAVEKQPPLRRATLLRDLWPVFDATPHVGTMDAATPEKSQALAVERHAELRKLVGRAMRRLELTEEEARELPDNYKMAIEEQLFAAGFDADSPEKPFLPADLFDENGPWVPMARSPTTVGALHHLRTVEYRSVFVALIRVSDNRQETINYLNETRHWRTRKPVPPGTQLALVRRLLLPTKSGRLVATPVTESVQFIVVDPPDDRRFKFVMDRAELLAGRPGLHAIDRDYPLDPYALEAGGLFPHFPKFDTDGEMLLLGRYLPSELRGPGSLGHCFACHGRTVGTNLFANTQRSHIAYPTTWADQLEQITWQKEKSAAWKAYQELRD